MRIVQISTDTLPVPPPKYGGIQRVVYSLTEELIKHGHEVYLYAPKGSHSNAKIIPYEHKGPNSDSIVNFVKKTMPPSIDIIHDHTHFSVIDQLNLPIPTVSTIHINNSTFPSYPVYISKKAFQEVGKSQGFFVYNGIDLDEYEFSEKKKDYLLFLGEVSEKKGIHHALEIAEKTKKELIIAGPIYNREYFSLKVEPRIKENPKITYIGEVGGEEKQTLLKSANCLLFPITWREPFGLVMVEAMACGTPVIALNNGSVPEIIGEFPQMICNNIKEMEEKVANQSFPSSKSLREHVSKYFTKEKMTDSYLDLYKKIIYEDLPPIHEKNVNVSSIENRITSKEQLNLIECFNYANLLKEQNHIKAIELFELCLASPENQTIYKLRACHELAKLYQQNGNMRKAKDFCFQSFYYDIPRAEFCCSVGFCFKNESDLNQAIFWFNLATELEKPIVKDELYDEVCWTWLPHLQLCVCYYRLGDYQKSKYHNELARRYLPNDWRILQNEKVLERKLKKEL